MAERGEQLGDRDFTRWGNRWDGDRDNWDGRDNRWGDNWWDDNWRGDNWRGDNWRGDNWRDGRRTAWLGQRYDSDWWYDNYVPLRYNRRYFYDFDDDDFDDFYDFDDDDYYYPYYYPYGSNYFYGLGSPSYFLTGYPLYGGAFAAGYPLPYAYPYYNVPLAYRPYYYDTSDYYYRYGGGAIYQLDPATQLVTAVVALLSGQYLGVGQVLPLGYDTYNVPFAYRDQYYDTNDAWYRYNDGTIYQADPRTRVIEASYPVASYPLNGFVAGHEASYPLNGFVVGQPIPAGYDVYNVPYAYRHLYYDTPEYYYRYANNSIYQVDAESRLIVAVVALLTGNELAVGSQLPLGYDTYNVPFAYRDRYYDSGDDMFRYSDGYVYRADPRTRVIRSVITLA